MSQIPAGLKYVSTHEWVRLEDNGYVTVGISDYAQAALGDIVFIDLPDLDREVNAGEATSVVESVKAASDIYSPISGKIVTVNDQLTNAPESVNNDPYGKGWLFRIQPSDKKELEKLLDADAYSVQVENAG